MTDYSIQNKNYCRISQAIEYLVKNHIEQPSLDELASSLGLSKYHLQRLFSDWAGVSPKQFTQYLTKEYAKQCLRQEPVFDSALSCGLSGSSRLHDLMVKYESVTPGEYRAMGEGVVIEYGVHPSMFGYCFVANTTRGLCKLSFLSNVNDQTNTLKELSCEWPSAVFKHNQESTALLVQTIFSNEVKPDQSLSLFLKGSPFQIQVWEALLKVPTSHLTSYQCIAEAINKPSAVRAVASAIGKNNIAYLIPCHRVIRSTGVLSKYRWGEERKAAMIGYEASKKELLLASK